MIRCEKLPEFRFRRKSTGLYNPPAFNVQEDFFMKIVCDDPDVQARIQTLPRDRVRLTIEYPARTWYSDAVFRALCSLVNGEIVRRQRETQEVA